MNETGPGVSPAETTPYALLPTPYALSSSNITLIVFSCLPRPAD